ncbi:MAG: thymidylate kinase, partial [Clostridia bacterium]
MSGRIIILEGTDASGKSTQLDLLTQHLRADGRDFRTVAFPRYSEDSSALIRMYLAGDFGKTPGDVNAYAASTFFAVDRYASYKSDWKDYYDAGGILLFDRYTTSNAVHQGAKLARDERERFWSWLFDFEYNLMGLPAPSAVLFLDMPPEFAARLLIARAEATDIHENDAEYRARCYEAA